MGPPGGGMNCTRTMCTMRAAPGRSWAVAVCVCVEYIIYSYLTVCINTKPGARQATRLARAYH